MSWAETATRLGLAIFFLYLFLVGVKSLETGISSFGSDAIDQIFGSVANPIAGLAAGILATVLVQSSSVSTATIVGLVGAGVLPYEYAIPPQADAGWIGEVGPGPSYLDEGSGGPENDFTNRNTTFLTWNLLHLARILKDAGGIPSHGNQQPAWDAGERFDMPDPTEMT
jgi:hypothetical protein